MERTVTLRDQVTAGLVAGIAGGILYDLFLFASAVANGAPAATAFPTMWTFIASAVLGPAAAANPAAPAAGAVLNFAVSIAWALGYVNLVRSQPQLLTRPFVSGIGFGIVVWVFMQLVLLTSGLYHRPSAGAFGTSLVANLIFYGLPVSYIVSRLLRRA